MDSWEKRRKAAAKYKSRWHQITDLGDPQQEKDFSSSKDVYEEVFEPEYRESHGTFRKYIQSPPTPGGPRDFYFVGKWSDSVAGMLFFTVYRGQYAFISYAGVSRRRLQGAAYAMLAAGMFGKLYEILETQSARGALYEVEQIAIDELTGGADAVAPIMNAARREAIVTRIKTTMEFQYLDAWKIPFIAYRQPKPDNTAEAAEVPMHLMYLPGPRAATTAPACPRTTVDEILRFIYEIFYLDGFDQSGNYLQGDREYTRSYLKRLRRKALKDYPRETELIKLRPGVFISYQSKDLPLVRQLTERLEAAGYTVWYWAQDSRHHVGRPVWQVIERYMEVLPITIFLLTKHYRRRATDYGQDEELGHARYRNYGGKRRTRRIVYLLERGAPSAAFGDSVDMTKIMMRFSRRGFRGFAQSFVHDLNRATADVPLFEVT